MLPGASPPHECRGGQKDAQFSECEPLARRVPRRTGWDGLRYGPRVLLGDYPHRLDIPTRWDDNDVYGHVNNVRYYAYFDTVINTYLIREGHLDIHSGETIGVTVASHCDFRAALAFPETVIAGLAVSKLGRTSVRYEIGLFGEGDDPARDAAATGWFVHVFVDRGTRRPVAPPGSIRAALESLIIDDPATRGSSTS
jgi:acyl-CoA thioester hydrolase